MALQRRQRARRYIRWQQGGRSWAVCYFFFSSRRRHTRYWRDWSSDVCSSDLSEILRSGVEFCELGFQVGFLPAQFSRLSCALTKFVDLVPEACNLSLLLLDCTSRFGEFGADRLFLILKLATGDVRFRSDGLHGTHRLRQVFSRGVEILLQSAGSIRLRLEGGLRASDFRFEFEFAALQGFVGRLQGCSQTFGFLGPLRNLPSPGLEEFSVVLDLARANLVLRLVLFCQAFRSFLHPLLGFFGGSFSFFDGLERLFGLEHSLRRQSRRFFGLRLPRLELRLTAREARLPVGEGFRSPVEFRPLGPQVRFFLGEFAGFTRPLPEFVHFVLQADDSVLPLLGRVLCFREFRGQRGLSVLALASCGLSLSARRLQVAEHLREILPCILEILLELRRSLVGVLSQRLPRLRKLGFPGLELRAGRFDFPLRLFHIAIRRVEFLLERGERLLAGGEFPVPAIERLDKGFDLPFALAEGRLLCVDSLSFLLDLLHRGLGVLRGGFVLLQVLEFRPPLPEFALEFPQGFLGLAC